MFENWFKKKENIKAKFTFNILDNNGFGVLCDIIDTNDVEAIVAFMSFLTTKQSLPVILESVKIFTEKTNNQELQQRIIEMLAIYSLALQDDGPIVPPSQVFKTNAAL